MKHFDVVVVGGGHAGAEAAHAAARLGVSVGLVTLKKSAVGVMSCNPAIGGLGKGHIVREIDALGGIMGLAADAAGIQFRLLNRRKGPAVQGPRAQTDRAEYRRAVQRGIRAQRTITVIEGEVVDLCREAGVLSGVVLADGTVLSAMAAVLTTGTFLRGVMHIGDKKVGGGRFGEAASVGLADSMAELGLPLGRLKTGTPPRLDGRTIDWSVLEKQPGDDTPELFSFMSSAPVLKQLECGITQTNVKTHDIIRSNLGLSAMYGGHIDGVGPRYCPSIEDKVIRFADKSSHQVFLEPESLSSHTVYPNGISTSLPGDVQEAYVRSIRGLEGVKIEQLGYAIEYDYIDPRVLNPCLELEAMPGLFLAGQINGTTGYEEAAGQGLLAGLNAARRAQGRDGVFLSRVESYIGVMVDDLVSRGVTEPYRMFTSRAEFRLSLRADNADQRLTPLGIEVGCVGAERARVFEKKIEALSRARDQVAVVSVSSADLARLGVEVSADGHRRSGVAALSLSGVDVSLLSKVAPGLAGISVDIGRQLKNDATYAHFIDRQKADAAAVKRDEAMLIPDGFDYGAVGGLSSELLSKLTRTRPRSIGQASRMEGMTPAALTLLLASIRRFGSSARTG